ncbi:FAD-dependent oxidoreductase, partial [Streptomyces purpurascens]
ETLVNAMHKRLTELGVEVLTRTAACAVTTDGAGVTGVRTEDGTFLPARQVLLTVAPELAANLLSAAGHDAPAHPAVPAVARRLLDIRYLANVAWSWRTTAGSPTRTGSTSTIRRSPTSASSSTPTWTPPAGTATGTSSTSPSTCRPMPSCTG